MNNSSWQQLHPAPATELAVADLDGNGRDDLTVAFSFGTWRWMNNSSWQQLHPAPATELAVADLDGNRGDDLIVAFSFGTWRWMNNNSWQQLHPAPATELAVADLDGSALGVARNPRGRCPAGYSAEASSGINALCCNASQCCSLNTRTSIMDGCFRLVNNPGAWSGGETSGGDSACDAQCSNDWVANCPYYYTTLQCRASLESCRERCL
jgi:hypothetical protein